MQRYKNQWKIIIHSSSGRKQGKKKKYGIITEEELMTASRVLDDSRNGTPYKLFTILCMNRDGFQLLYSPAALVKQYGGSIERWQRAAHVLIDKGYLVFNHRNTFDFYSLPRDVSAEEYTAADRYPCRQGECTPADKGRNNTNIMEPKAFALSHKAWRGTIPPNYPSIKIPPLVNIECDGDWDKDATPEDIYTVDLQ